MCACGPSHWIKSGKYFIVTIIHRQHAAGFGDNNENTVFLSFLSSTTRRISSFSFSSPTSATLRAAFPASSTWRYLISEISFVALSPFFSSSSFLSNKTHERNERSKMSGNKKRRTHLAGDRKLINLTSPRWIFESRVLRGRDYVLSPCDQEWSRSKSFESLCKKSLFRLKPCDRSIRIEFTTVEERHDGILDGNTSLFFR